MQFCLSRTVIAPTSACQRLRLVGFQRTKVQAGESKTLKFVLSSESMMFVDENGEHRLEPGWFRVMVGSCSAGERGQTLGAPAPQVAYFDLISSR